MESFTIPFQLATDFINGTNRAVFLTGKAGTGKTTFLREIKQHTHKQTAVVAPTGVAAINAGGSTIHSFFQLPFNPYLPEKKPNNFTGSVSGKNELIGRLRLTSKRRKILQELELLIIDEISMVRCDTLDAIDVILRHFRYRPNEPFGGVQLLLIGDMFQLSPVAADSEWNELSRFYKSPYFFDSRVIMQQPPIYIELDKIYRQKNEDFISVLNGVRNNDLSPKGYELLQNRFDPHFVPGPGDNYITLSTHNYIADQINARELAAVPGKLEIFKATVKGEYPEKHYPLDSELKLKVGAKVMFVKNDLQPDKRYYNGKIGTIISIDKESIEVQCPNESSPIIVSQYIWENVKYEVDAATQLLDETIVGTFQQFPLRLAWAITIHKSQGLTFEKAIIDAGKAFAPGQVYVALSRCTSLEGLVLMSPIHPGSLSNDQHIIHHSKSKPEIKEIEKFLIKERGQFQQQLLDQLFDFGIALGQLESLLTFVQANSGSFDSEAESSMLKVRELLLEFQLTAKKFQSQLHSLHADNNLLNADLQKRITAGSAYFTGKISEVIILINRSAVQTDSKLQAESFNDSIKDIFVALAQKEHIMSGIAKAFSVEEYFKARRNFVVPPFSVNAYSGVRSNIVATTTSGHPDLLHHLQALRNEICRGKDLPVYIVASTATLVELTDFLPLTLEDLGKISGFGPTKVQTYGSRFLQLIQEYCAMNNLKTLIHLKPSKSKKSVKESKNKPLKADTKLTTLHHFKSGKTIRDIAQVRNLTLETIVNHLVNFIDTGEIRLEQLVAPEKIEVIVAAINSSTEKDLTSLKTLLGDDFSYSEIRLVSKFNKT
jgi:hypothetical protein